MSGPRVLDVLVPAAGAGDGPAVAAELGLEWRTAGSLSAFLERVAQSAEGPFLISAAMDEVEPALVERIAERVVAGGLLLSSPGASLEWAVLARHVGAGALLREPLVRAEMVPALGRCLDRPRGLEIPASEDDPPSGGGEPELIGSGKGMMEVVRGVAELGPSPVTVLVTGESGAGKEVVARALHWASRRREGPFVAINCAAVPESLLEAEFFGHEKGAFTGATASKAGRFERAEGGTLFLDEVGDMSPVLQAKLLRALEEREIERLGGDGPIPVDVRVLAATHRPLEEGVRAGDFREDLFFRLAAARIEVPPLRERPEDLPELVIYFVRRFSRNYERPVRGVTDEAMRLLRVHHWPGNVRELRNVLDRAVLASHGGWIRPDDLALGAESPTVASPRTAGPGIGYPPNTPMEEVERHHIARVLAFTRGAMTETAEILGIHRNTLRRKVNRYGLQGEGGR